MAFPESLVRCSFAGGIFGNLESVCAVTVGRGGKSKGGGGGGRKQREAKKEMSREVLVRSRRRCSDSGVLGTWDTSANLGLRRGVGELRAASTS